MKSENNTVANARLASSVLIGVASAGRRTGTTHAALQIACLLANQQHKVACVELASTHRPSVFHTFAVGKRSTFFPGGFQIAGVDFFQEEHQILKYMAAGYDFIVIDAGVIDLEDVSSEQALFEYFRTEIQFMTTGCSLWDFYQLNDLLQRMNELSINIPHHILLNFADESLAKEVRGAFTKNELKRLAIQFLRNDFQPNPFKVQHGQLATVLHQFIPQAFSRR